MPADEQSEQPDNTSDSPIEESDDNNRKLPPDLVDQLRGLCKKFAGRELKDRRWEVRRVRKARYFFRGQQHLLWNDDSQTMVVGALGGVTTAAAGNSSNMPTFVRDYNIYTPYCKAFMATFTQNQPATRFEPENPKEPIDIQSAAAANNYRRAFEKWNPPKQLQQEFARLFWTDERVVAWTRYEEDGEKYGYDKSTDPPRANGREITTLHGVLEHKCPITIKDPQDFPYQQISIDLDTVTVKGKFPWVADEIANAMQGTMDDAFARNARIATNEGTTVLSEGSDALAYLTTIDYMWLRPDAFRSLEDEYRDAFLAKFPRGCRATFVGDVFCECPAVAMNDQLTVFHATEGDGQNRNGVGDWLVPVQEVFNNLMNMSQEYAEYGIPVTYYDQSLEDTDAKQEQRNQPGNSIPIMRPAGLSVSDCFFTTLAGTPPEFMMPFMEYLQGQFAQFVTGQQASLFGEGDKHNETAKGIALLRNQALGLVSLVWMPFTLGWAAVVGQAVKAARENRDNGSVITTMVSAGPRKANSETVEIDVEDLRGNVLSYPETDENFPESWTVKSDKIMQLFTEAEKNPAFQTLAMVPENQHLFKMATGLEELTIPGADSNDKQLEEIEELLKEPPVENVQAVMLAATQAMQQGQPFDITKIPQTPQFYTTTIPIDPDFDDSGAEWQAGQVWVNDPEQGQKIKRENPQGFFNVRLHLLGHKQVNDAKAQQQMQQQLALKHPAQPGPDPGMEAVKQHLVGEADDALKQLDVLAHIPAPNTAGNIQGQVAAAKAITDLAAKLAAQ